MLELFQRSLQLVDVVVPQDQAPYDPVVGVVRVRFNCLLDFRDRLGVLVPLEEGEGPVAVAAMVAGAALRLVKGAVDVLLSPVHIVPHLLGHGDLREVDLGLLADRQSHLVLLMHVEDEGEIVVGKFVSLFQDYALLEVLDGNFVIRQLEVGQAEIVAQLCIVCLGSVVVLSLQLAAPLKHLQSLVEFLLLVEGDAKVEEPLGAGTLLRRFQPLHGHGL